MKFYKQLKDYTCGPIAVLNFLKWSGGDVTRKKNFTMISDQLGTDIFNGTSLNYIVNFLVDFTYVKVNENPKLTEVTESFIMLYVPDKRLGTAHFVFVYRNNKKWSITNHLNRDGTYEHRDVTNSQLKKILNKTGTHVCMLKD